MKLRMPNRTDLSRTLLAYGAFAAASKLLDGDDKATLAHLRKLRKRLQDERGEAIGRVIRNLKAIQAAEKAGTRTG